MDVLPTPVNLIGLDGQVDANGYSGPGFASVSLTSNEAIQHSIHQSGRYDMSRAANPHYWTVEVQYNDLLCEDFHVVYPFLLRMQDGLKSFYVELPQYKTQGVPDVSVSSAGGWGYNTIEVSVGTNHVTPGTVFTDTNGKMYYVTRVETSSDYWSGLSAPASGVERLHVSPTFQTAIESGSLDFTTPLLKVRLSSSLAYSVNPDGLYSFGISLEETV